MSFTLAFGQEGNCATAQVVWSVDGKTYNFRSDNNFVAWISTIFTVADVVAGGGGSALVSSDQNPPVQGGVGNLWAEYGTTGSVVGNARGVGAVDWQQYRNLVTQVASGIGSTVGGGLNNTASGDYSTVGGGDNNTAFKGSTVGGGLSNTTSGFYATIGGGTNNTASSDYTKVGGGKGNTASGNYATVGGGYTNTASGVNATVGGGYTNGASATNATVGGGTYNSASGLYATVGGGRNNIASASGATVGGGYANEATLAHSTVAGGYDNNASGLYATMGGGYKNTAPGNYSKVGGGSYNSGSGQFATIGGGYKNTVTVSEATVGGGTYNTASGVFGTVGGGNSNTASGNYATVGGGYDALADRYGMVAHASGKFSSNGDAQAVEFVARNITSGASSSVLFFDGAGDRFTVTNNSVLSGILTISGFNTTGTKVGLYQRSISIKNVAGTTTLVHVSTISTDHEDDATWNVTITADNATDSLNIACLGSVGDDVRWVAVFRGLQILMP